jgi:MraZ protein
MFIGEFTHSVDKKGRLAIPAKFRKKLAQGAVVTRGLDDCLFLYPKNEWEKLAKKLSQLPISQKNARAFARLMLAGAYDVDLDKQGRIVIPQYLRKFASIKNETVIAGLYSRLEIWDVTKWNKYKKGAEKESTDIAEHLSTLGV